MVTNPNAQNTAAQERGTEGDYISMFTLGLLKPGDAPVSSDTERVTNGLHLLADDGFKLLAANEVMSTGEGLMNGTVSAPDLTPAPTITQVAIPNGPTAANG